MSNSVQLKHVFKQGSNHQFYGTQVFLGMISIFMCTCIGKLSIRWRNLLFFHLLGMFESFVFDRISRYILSFTDSRRCTNVYVSLRSSTIVLHRHNFHTFSSTFLRIFHRFLRLFLYLEHHFSRHSNLEILRNDLEHSTLCL